MWPAAIALNYGIKKHMEQCTTDIDDNNNIGIHLTSVELAYVQPNN